MNFSINQPRTTPALEKYPLHLALFLMTVLTTLWAGAFWAGQGTLLSGLPYSFCLLLFLSVHEFGHYFTALHHRVRATLPYYIPVPPLPMFLSLGTNGSGDQNQGAYTEYKHPL